MINLIVGEYLRSLKERNELDSIFLLLLDQMEFEIQKSAQSSHGQPEYGNDITAVKIDDDGIKKIFIFQLKGGNDKNINATNFNKKDGIRESILQAIDVNYIDKSKPELFGLKKKIVLVHNGEINNNIKEQFNGFIDNNFNDNIDFVRWDIFNLTELFSKYLFNEYLLVKQEYLNLFKKSLAFIDIPEGNFMYFKQLVDSILDDLKEYNEKYFNKVMALFNMMSSMIFHYAKEANNLEPAKQCITYILLKSWGWALEKNVEDKDNVIENILKLNFIHFFMLDEYFLKTIPVTKEQDGLFINSGKDYETIGYPIRALEYIGYLVIYIYFFPFFFYKKEDEYKKVLIGSIESLIQILKNNSGCSRPLLDNHSVPILLVIKLLYENSRYDIIKDYIFEIFNNIAKIKTIRNRMPELYNNIDALVEFCATNERPSNYYDSSSYLLEILIEICIKFDNNDIFNDFSEYLTKNIELLVYFPPEDIVENEHILFQKELTDVGYSDIIQIRKIEDASYPLKSFDDLKKELNEIKTKKLEFRTDKRGLRHLRYLAHLFYKTPFFPDEWRILIDKK